MLAGKLALVTGAGSGIGRAICQAFAKEGAMVAMADVNKDGVHQVHESLKSISEGNHQPFTVDVSSSASVATLMTDIRDRYMAVPTIAVNSAGITRDTYMLKMKEEMWDEVINVNLKGTFLLNKAVSQAIVENKLSGGSIINLSSIVGKVGNVGQTNYGASKAGVIGFTKSAAKEVAKFNIRVNAILPGFIKTPMTEKVPEHLMQITQMLIPMTKLGEPEDIADACVFLASDKSRYITGATLEVSGGLFM
ncbi:17beta-estradiol 17-dehydrogenase / 3alpha(17beta)-hydroxysteroid dehydrogenase (NAD+) [Mytilus galloprovincialis]|uniref:(3R)-3-hydroxyacyl-CoA dehydrogenase n=1 Tax=Mytilus galloprovincialis TaxID=29158 RepID=A0A8B6CBD1_MYTGA|nr:17beta-estradiol 17-dehydrogenase / 3alpha(17beta)-hydroxysteroid dehydrogenase (NAD+) [Mytilus galloprovincialis]